MTIDWNKNAYNLGKDFLFVLLWVASWSLVDMGVDHWSKSEKSIKLRIYIGLFVVSFLVMLIVGNGYAE